MTGRNPSPAPPSRWAVLAVTATAVFMAFLDTTIVNIAFPSIQSAFDDADLAELSWVLNAYNVTFAALLVPAGRLADLLGRRRLFTIGLLAFVAASALCGAAPSVEVLIAARVAQAAGAAMLIPASLALLLPAFPLEQRATAVGLWGAAGALSAAIGPSLGGVLVEAFGWRSVFYVNLPLGLLAVAAGARVLTESRDPERGAVPDLLGIALAAAAMGLATLGIVQANDWGWGGGRVVASLLAAGALGALFVWRSSRHPTPVVELSLLRVRTFAVANAGTLLFASAFYALLLCNVLYLTQVWGYSTLTAGLALTPGPIAGAVVAGPAGLLADRFGQRVVTAPGAVIFALGAWLFIVRAGPDPSYVDEWLPQTVLIGIGIGMTFPALTSAAAAALPASRYGIGSAVNAAARQLGAVLGIALLVAILGTPSGAEALDAFDDGWSFIALAGLATAFVALALRDRARTQWVRTVPPGDRGVVLRVRAGSPARRRR